jgi:hypothetical protein
MTGCVRILHDCNVLAGAANEAALVGTLMSTDGMGAFQLKFMGIMAMRCTKSYVQVQV